MSLNFKFASHFTKLLSGKALERIIRSYASAQTKNIQVTLCGAAGKIGQSLSLLLKQSAAIDKLVLHDTISVGGIALDLSHVDTKCKVEAQSGVKQTEEAFKNSDIVVIVACAPNMSNASYTAAFESNAGVVRDLTECFAKVCPKALLIIATNPVNSMVPLASEVLAAQKVLDTKKVFGVTTLNIIRANTFVGELLDVNPENVMVPVVGGNAGTTIVPLLSQITPCLKFTPDELQSLVYKIQNAHHEVIKVKHHNEVCHLSCAYATAKFVVSAVKALRGANNIIKCTFIRSKVHPHSKYFSSPVLLGKGGIDKIFKLPTELLEYEKCLIERAVPLIMKDVRRGEEFVNVIDPEPCDPCISTPKKPCPKDWCSEL